MAPKTSQQGARNCARGTDGVPRDHDNSNNITPHGNNESSGGFMSLAFGAIRALRHKVDFYLREAEDAEEKAARIEREKRKVRFEKLTNNIDDFRKLKAALRRTGMITNGGVMEVLFVTSHGTGDLLVATASPQLNNKHYKSTTRRGAKKRRNRKRK
mmetsp:Transcript_53170/g.64062  ORF Transcript_53170/g.64062 Transcript_53170/m.64062 type:complete len:157 (-) Transcript_53170:209-679(-)|eukprot:CAMPEP_0172498564 /NCGR_PEP_ID=MMETSP1066-20121228/113751_1 /TAXON_ID=671091 /ORGANISM="Coscinodiscus wailesii, Strain CCMP2513" /LENGTH=156 /DNA_ID=CAMNT_0013271877 /DNA_START=51 /DNA_END=524 /DNA_ORIENTATION=-